MQVVQTGDTVKRQEALAREARVEKPKHHINAIIDDDFWQVVKHEKLGEGDFEVESSMSFGGSLWCRRCQWMHIARQTMTKIDRRITLTIDRRHLLNRLRSVVKFGS
ncbi:hypothetical protein DY000_02045194 [Brassica cretica]|uniref:Uncharacterized protein n=1 Tax=Brassica cretica TaxID=69181 RepID=A0ABQ7ET79_BRACR|nr:hypothetical protein DY000_02045194 [Brassica cretica]